MPEDKEEGVLGGVAQDGRIPDSGPWPHQRYSGHTPHHCPHSRLGVVYFHCGALGGSVCGA